MIKKQYVQIVLCVALIVGLGQTDVWSLSCADPPYKDERCLVAFNYQNTDMVFMGKLMRVKKRLTDVGWPVYTSEFQVTESYSGLEQDKIKILSEGWSEPPKRVGGYYVVFAMKKGPEIYAVNPCSTYQFVELDSVLVHSSLISQLQRMSTTPEWNFLNEQCQAEGMPQIRELD